LVFVGNALGASGFLDFFLVLSGKLSAYVGHAILLLLHDGAKVTMTRENKNNHNAFIILVYCLSVTAKISLVANKK
jgi:hypothetical protein